MSLLTDFETQALAEDGDWLTFVAHKLVHICTGALVALPVMDLVPNLKIALPVAFGVALVVGIIRELDKTTPMLLHVVTALITMSGAGVAFLLSGGNPIVQIIGVLVMIVYSIVITLLQLFKVNF